MEDDNQNSNLTPADDLTPGPVEESQQDSMPVQDSGSNGGNEPPASVEDSAQPIEPALALEQSVSVPPNSFIKNLLVKAQAKIQFNKNKKLEKVFGLVVMKKKVSNEDVQKLLHCSSATATRYLSQLVKACRIKMQGPANDAFYEPNA